MKGKIVQIYCNELEAELIERLAENNFLSVSSYIKHKILAGLGNKENEVENGRSTER